MKLGKALILMTVLMLSSMFAFTMIGVATPVAKAQKVTTGNQLVYTDGTGANLASLMSSPSFLIVHADTIIDSTTTVEVQGQDENGQNVQGTVVMEQGTAQETLFLVVDQISGNPVEFATITNVMQQNGTYGDSWTILTQPWPIVALGQNAFQYYLGEYHASLGAQGYHPDHMSPSDAPPYPPEGYYQQAVGPGIPFIVVFGTPQPAVPSSLVIYINWKDNNHDLIVDNVGSGLPNADTLTPATGAATIYIEGLDQAGNKLIGVANIQTGATNVAVVTPNGATFSEVDQVYGQGHDSYYIFTNPGPSIPLVSYTVMIDHINMYPATYDILASLPEIEGQTPILVAFVDSDNNLVHTSDTFLSNVTLSFYTSGGAIEPSREQLDLSIALTCVWLNADTSPRTIKVVVDAIIPAINQPNVLPSINTRSWFEMTMDGVSSVLSTTWPIHQLMWGYNDTASPAGVTLPVTPKPPWQAFVEEDPWDVVGCPGPWETENIGGVAYVDPDISLFDSIEAPPQNTLALGTSLKLDGPIYEVAIPLYPGCNLISSPVRPMLDEYFSGYPLNLPQNNGLYNTGIPMALLFHWTTSDNIESVWWFTPNNHNYWNVYIPSTDTWIYGNATYSHEQGGSRSGPYFVDGVGYWVKADKACTIELSGIVMENAPFTPNVYSLAPFKYNLVGFTSVVPLATSSYLEGLAVSGAVIAPGLTETPNAGAVGVKAPVWVWNAQYQIWTRDPATLWPTQGFWLFTSANLLAP